jgi:hypothetical protein
MSTTATRDQRAGSAEDDQAFVEDLRRLAADVKAGRRSPPDRATFIDIADRIAAMTPDDGRHLDSTDIIRDMRDNEAR